MIAPDSAVTWENGSFFRGPERLSFLGAEAFHDQLVGVINEFANQFAGYCSIEANGIPVFFVHVIAGSDVLILFAKFDRAIRVAFQIDE